MSRITASVGILALIFSSATMSRDTKHLLPIEDALNMPAAKEKLNAGIRFYFSGQNHPPVDRSIVEAVSNKKTNAFGKSDTEACQWVFLSALIAFQDRAISEGGNAVVDLVSYYKKNTYESSTQYECHAGGIMAGVALKGRVVKLAD